MPRHLFTLLCLTHLAGCSCTSPGPPPTPVAPYGHFDGNVIAQWDDDGRFMTLRDKFGYIDANNKSWLAPAGAKINGASIPQAFWTFIGGPFEGQYRNASVVHDVYCESKTEPWEDVHEMFYRACRCGGVEETKAKLMYWAVYHYGPRWDQSKPLPTDSKTWGKNGPSFAPMTYHAKTADESTLAAAQAYFESHNPTLDEIKQLDIAPQ